MFQTNVVEKIKTHILGSITFFPKKCRLWDNVEKYCRSGEPKMTIWASVLHAGYPRLQTHTLRLC